jgi:N-acetylglucosaminyldiphosphoundecaprenol N-acetyl-beta-D-mannosaminyltransferase
MTRPVRQTLLDVRIGVSSLEQALSEALDAVDRRRDPVVFACANPHSLVTAQRDPAFIRALCNAEQLVADGVGVALMAKLARVDVGPRITGTDYFLAVMSQLDRRGHASVYFFGSSESVLGKIEERLARDYPNVRVAGTCSPPFGSWSAAENASMIERINAAAPDVLWVGMTAPKQEKWVEQNRARLDARLIGSIGAVFDFYAGVVPRAPGWMCASGIEWLYRLAREPRRLWRRNVVSTPLFVAMTLWRDVLKRRS